MFSSLKKEVNSLENAENKIRNVIGIEENDSVEVSFNKRPLKLSYVDIENGDYSHKKIKYDSDAKAYIFNPVWDSGECWISVVADYGVVREVITFCVYNKDYMPQNGDDIVKYLPDSSVSDSNRSNTVLLKTDSFNYPVESTAYAFKITNSENNEITTSDFIVEKRIGDKWYVVEKEMNSFVAQNLSPTVMLKDTVLKGGETRDVKLETSLYLLFDESVAFENNSGVYRYVVPYTSGGQTHYAVSNEFTVGYVSDANIQK
ncbi:MAG: hypothetical protein MJ168_08360 [Clostridia bacterium]|nr:hypothetical protein [Clostridia bacterium]